MSELSVDDAMALFEANKYKSKYTPQIPPELLDPNLTTALYDRMRICDAFYYTYDRCRGYAKILKEKDRKQAIKAMDRMLAEGNKKKSYPPIIHRRFYALYE